MKQLATLLLLLLFNSIFAHTIAHKDAKPVELKTNTKPIKVKTKNIYPKKPETPANEYKKNEIVPQMVFVAGGSFYMGSTISGDEQPVHKVTLSSFNMGKYEVTVAEYKAFCQSTGESMPDKPSWGWNDKHPIVNVNFDDAIAYCTWLSKKLGKIYRLPTEAEWEYGARGGQNSKYCSFSGSNAIDDVAWYRDNSGGQVQVVGGKRPNELGLYDMTGNVWEWCKDWYDSSYYNNSPSSDPKGGSYPPYRVLRGGSWYLNYEFCSVTYRNYCSSGYRNNYYGFRVVCPK